MFGLLYVKTACSSISQIQSLVVSNKARNRCSLFCKATSVWLIEGSCVRPVRRPCFPVGSVREAPRTCPVDGCVVRERRAVGGVGCRLAVRLARIDDPFLAMHTHSLASDGKHVVWNVRGLE